MRSLEDSPMKRLSLLFVLVVCVFVFSPDIAHADYIPLDIWCSTVGDWDSGEGTCTMTQDATVYADDTLFIQGEESLFTGARGEGYTLHNHGTIEHFGGVVNLDGIINNYGDGSIINYSGGILNNHIGTLNNNGIITNWDHMQNSGTLYNSGWIDNHGNLYNHSLIFNYYTINNQGGTFDNYGIIVNYGVILGNPINNYGDGAVLDKFLYIPLVTRN